MVAIFLCAAPLITASAQASTGMLEREALREVIRQRVHAARSRVIALPLPERPRASAAAASPELARIARSDAPERLLVGLRAHEDMGAVAAKLRALGATPAPLEITGVLAATVPSGAAAVAALRDDPRVAYIERDPEADPEGLKRDRADFDFRLHSDPGGYSALDASFGHVQG